MFVCSQGQDDAVLLRRGHAGEHHVGFRDLKQRCVDHALQIAAQHHPAHVQPDNLADVPGDQFVVAGQNLDAYASGPHFTQHLTGIGQRRVAEGHETHQRQVMLVAGMVCGLLICRSNAPPSHRDHPEALGGEALYTARIRALALSSSGNAVPSCSKLVQTASTLSGAPLVSIR